MQHYTYGNIEDAEPYAGEDGSRVISFFIFNTDVHLHAYSLGRDAAGPDGPGARGVAGAADAAAAGGDMAAAGVAAWRRRARARWRAATCLRAAACLRVEMHRIPPSARPTSTPPCSPVATGAGISSSASPARAKIRMCRAPTPPLRVRSRWRPRPPSSWTSRVRIAPRAAGAFDITMGTVTRLWDFHEGVVPSSLELARALPHVGSRQHRGRSRG